MCSGQSNLISAEHTRWRTCEHLAIQEAGVRAARKRQHGQTCLRQLFTPTALQATCTVHPSSGGRLWPSTSPVSQTTRLRSINRKLIAPWGARMNMGHSSVQGHKHNLCLDPEKLAAMVGCYVMVFCSEHQLRCDIRGAVAAGFGTEQMPTSPVKTTFRGASVERPWSVRGASVERCVFTRGA